MATKKKLEVLFRSYFQTEKNTDVSIKAFLEETISNLKVKSIETYAGKGNVKAVVNSNIVDLLVGTDSAEEGDMMDYKRGKSMSFMGKPPGLAGLSFGSDPIELAFFII